jgi:hypothetical protein
MVSSIVGIRFLYRAMSCSNLFCSVSDSLSEQCDTSESRVCTNHFMSSRLASTSWQMLWNKSLRSWYLYMCIKIIISKHSTPHPHPSHITHDYYTEIKHHMSIINSLWKNMLDSQKTVSEITRTIQRFKWERNLIITAICYSYIAFLFSVSEYCGKTDNCDSHRILQI